MRVTAITILVLGIVIGPAARSQEKGAQVLDRPGAGQTGAVEFSPEFRNAFVKLQMEADKLSEAAEKAFLAARTKAEQEAVFEQTLQTEQKEGAALAGKALELVKSSPRDLTAGEVLVWVLEKFPGSPAAIEAADLLAKSYLKSRKSQFVASQFALAPMSWTVKLLRAFTAQKDLPEQQLTQAFLDLGLALKNQAAMKGMLRGADAKKLRFMELRFGREYLDWLRNADTAKLHEEAIQHLNLVIRRESVRPSGVLRDTSGKLPPVSLSDRANAAIKEIRSSR